MFPLGNVSKIKKIFGGFMKSVTKKVAIAGLGAACVVSLSLFTGILAKNNGVANADGNNAPDATDFFYDYLLDVNNNEYTLAKRFYEALEEINQAGDFKKGVVDYPINNIVTSAQLKSWVEDGNLEVPRAFSAARDSFLTDHPEIFYVDFYKLTISVAKSGSSYVGFIDSGKNANVFRDNGFNTVTAVANAIEQFESKVNTVVTAVNNAQATDTYSARDVYLAREVNRYLAESIQYDYGSYENKDDPDAATGAYINTPYGGLVDNLAVCGGYSTAYKVIMDRLGIPCITVNGYSNNKDQNGNNNGTSVLHMWNYVWLENPVQQTKSRAANSVGEWYSVDVTWDDTAGNVNRYAVLSAASDEQYHVNDGVISSSGYRLRYPELSSHNYGSTGETDGLQYSIEYIENGLTDDFGNPMVSNYVSVSYNGKSAKRLLQEDGLYIVYRNADYYNSQIRWTDWASLEIFRQYAVDHGGIDNADSLIQDNGTETRYYDNTSVYYTQFAVFDVKSDRATPNSNPNADLGHDPETEPYLFYYYSNDLVEKSNAISIGDALINRSYGTYYAPPYITESTPSQQVTHTISDSMRSNNGDSLMDAKNAFTIEVKYDQKLHILDENEKIGVSFVSEHPNALKYAFFVPLDGKDTYAELVDEYTLRFKFCPSLMYEHNGEDYLFYFTNVGSAKEVIRFVDGEQVVETLDKLPNPAYFSFDRNYLACPARFNYDGRLWVDCCAQPELVSNSDLSEMNFEDEEGNTMFAADSRSQMMLVAEKVTNDAENEILDEIANSSDDIENAGEIVTSETYNIYLQICGKTSKITDGSYVKIALGFPEGYGPESEGVTFKIYHRKHVSGDNYIIEEIPCVVTQFGIVAVTTSFSPYTVAVLEGDKTTSKNIYASIEGKGGTLSKKDGRIISLTEQNDSYTYTIQPDAGYQIHSVTLNGENIANRVVNGKLTLTYDELDANNQLVIEYISNEAAARYQQKVESSNIDGFVDITKYVVPVDQQPVYPDFAPIVTPNAKAGSNKTVIIVVTVVCVALAVAASVTVTVIALRKKRKQ